MAAVAPGFAWRKRVLSAKVPPDRGVRRGGTGNPAGRGRENAETFIRKEEDISGDSWAPSKTLAAQIAPGRSAGRHRSPAQILEIFLVAPPPARRFAHPDQSVGSCFRRSPTGHIRYLSQPVDHL